MEKQLRAANDQELRQAVKVVSELMQLVDEYKKDNKLGLPEWRIAMQLVEDVPPLLKDSALLFPQWITLDQAAQADLVQFIKDEVKYSQNMIVEAYAEKILSTIVKLSEVAKIWA